MKTILTYATVNTSSMALNVDVLVLDASSRVDAITAMKEVVFDHASKLQEFGYSVDWTNHDVTCDLVAKAEDGETLIRKYEVKPLR